MTTTNTTQKKKTVAVIGLGPSGLVATKELKAKGFDVTAFDGQDSIGGVWSSPQTAKHGVYHGLCMNSSRRFTEYSDYPWNKEDYASKVAVPDQGGMYASAEEFKLYLDSYADHFDLHPCFQLKTYVLNIERRTTTSGGYTIITKRAGENEEGEENIQKQTHAFDAVVICTGPDGKPNNHLKDTLFKDCKSQVLHSQQFKSVEDFDNKRVLVVGACVSGSDISARLAERGKCKRVVNAVRNIPFHIDKFSSINDRSFEENNFFRLLGWALPHLPYSVEFQGLKQAAIPHDPEQLTKELTGNPDLVLNDDLRVSYVGYTTGYIKSVKEKKLIVKPEVTSVNGGGQTVFFKDGSEEEFDAIILSTGYKGWDLSILPDDIREEILYTNPTGAVEPALYNRCLVPSTPDLAFVGLINLGGICPVSEMLARYVAAVFNDDIPRPSEKKLKAGAAAFRKHRSAGRFNRYDITIEIQEMVGNELGVIPTTFQAMMKPSELLFGPMYPSYYRTNPKIDGKEVAKKALERYEWCKKNPQMREYQ